MKYVSIWILFFCQVGIKPFLSTKEEEGDPVSLSKCQWHLPSGV